MKAKSLNLCTATVLLCCVGLRVEALGDRKGVGGTKQILEGKMIGLFLRITVVSSTAIMMTFT